MTTARLLRTALAATAVLGAAVLGSARPAFGYVSYHRLGYVSCTACHSVSTGGGLLTPYGRTVGQALAILARESDLEDNRFRAGVQARPILLDSSTRANPFLMQADLLAAARLTEGSQVHVTAGPNLRWGQEFASVAPDSNSVVARRLMGVVALNETDSLEIGRDSPVAALNLDDHTAFARTRNRRGLFDYPTQLRFVRQTESSLLIPYLAAPSFEELDANREYAAGGRAEFLLDLHNSYGGTLLYGNTPAISRLSAGAFGRFSLAHWNGIMAEATLTRRSIHASGSVFNQGNVYVRPFVTWPEWCETSWIVEYLRAGDPFAETTTQHGPEVNLRIHEHLSVLGDGRRLTTATTSNWSWYAQLYVHFQI